MRSIYLILACIALVLLSGCVLSHTEGVVSGVIHINGSALSPTFSRYTLEYGSGKDPQSFSSSGITLTNQGIVQVNNSLLGTLDTKTLGEGLYTIKLSVFDQTNQRSDDFLYVNVDNVQILEPADGSVILGTAGQLQLNGTTYVDKFASFGIRVGPSGSTLSTQGITLTNNGLSLIDNGPLAIWNIASLASGIYDVQLVVTLQNGTVIEEMYSYELLKPDAFEVDDVVGQAKVLPLDGTLQPRTLVPGNDTDFVKFEALAGDLIIISTRNLSPSADTVLTLYDQDGVTVLDVDDDSGEEPLASQIVFEPSQNGTYFLAVTSFTEFNQGSYSLRGTRLSEDAFEQDDDHSIAKPIATDGTIQSHNFAPEGDVDYLSFDVIEGATYDVLTSNLANGADTWIIINDEKDHYIVDNDLYLLNDFGPSRVMFKATENASRLVRVEDRSSSVGGSYDISVTRRIGADDVFEDDDDFVSATTIDDGLAQSHNFSENYDSDFVKFTSGAQAENYTIETMNLASNTDTAIYLYNGPSYELGINKHDDIGSGREPLASKITFTADPNTTYFAEIISSNGGPGGQYDVRLTKESPTAPPAPPSPPPPTPPPTPSPSPSGAIDLLVQSSVTMGSEKQRRNSPVSTTLTIKNPSASTIFNTQALVQTGDSSATSQESSLNLSGSAIPSTIGPGQSQTVTISANVPLDFSAVNDRCEAEAFKIGTLMLRGDNGANLTIQKNVDILLRAENKLKIKDTDACIGSNCQSIDNGDKVKGAKPADKIELTVEVENTFADRKSTDGTSDIEMTDGELLVEGEDEVDVDESEEISDLDAQDSDDIDVEFEVEDDADAGNYDLTLRACATDENGALHGDIVDAAVEVERETHEVLITSAQVSPKQVSCDATVRVLVDVENTGKRDEDDVNLEVSIPSLGLEERRSDISLDEDDSSREPFTFKLPSNASAKDYTVIVRAYYDGTTLSDEGQTSLTIKPCVKQAQSSPKKQKTVKQTLPASASQFPAPSSETSSQENTPLNPRSATPWWQRMWDELF